MSPHSPVLLALHLPLVCAVLALAAQPAWAQPQGKPPAAVARWVAELMGGCSKAGGRPAKSPGLVTVADLNADGLPDYVVDASQLNCDGAGSLYAGPTGAEVALFIGRPGGAATKAYNGMAYGATVDATTTPHRVTLNLAGLPCGQANADRLPFSEWKACSRPLRWVAARNAFELGPPAPAGAAR
ncbi:MAG: hypothetical protein KGJ44_00345 [Betaproteobacteria bacterium]|nr:hypothetical protein [Betaproteobacteria bacterium]MDE2046837.1 hypothetical protein [Betaproteobacteria bacterium]